MTASLPEAVTTVAARMPDPWSTDQVDLYERELAEHFDIAEAIAVASGSAAVHCALIALRVSSGDEVLVSAAASPSSIAPVLYVDAVPVFVDCGTGGASLDLQDLAAKITDRTRAVLPVHLWGRTGDIVGLVEFAGARGLHVIEDAREATGTRFDDQHAGTFGDLGCMSTNDKQILWCGQGGFILTRDTTLAQRCRAARSHWRTPPAGQRPHAALGHNYEFAEPLAAIARFNLARLDELLDRRRHQSQLLTTLLTGAPGIRPIQTVRCEEPNQQFPLFRIDLRRPREFSARLAAVGILNYVGNYQTFSADQVPLFARYATEPCLRARNAIDTSLAVILTQHNTDDHIHQIAQTITQEARTWPSS